jgi:lipoprotein-anchoring transpeptidase ErfK/SrfK
MRVPIAVGTSDSPTPGGHYYLTMLFKVDNPEGPYGPWAFGISGFSDVYTTFANGNGEIGIHGTNEPWLVGGDVSHGCIRLRNNDITRLAAMVPLGAPVVIHP